jgi:hypothetical protein
LELRRSLEITARSTMLSSTARMCGSSGIVDMPPAIDKLQMLTIFIQGSLLPANRFVLREGPTNQ